MIRHAHGDIAEDIPLYRYRNGILNHDTGFLDRRNKFRQLAVLGRCRYGGLEPGYLIVDACIKRGKHLSTRVLDRGVCHFGVLRNIFDNSIQLDIVFHDERVLAELRYVRTKALTLVEEGLLEHLSLILRNEGARRESGDNHDDKHHAQKFELNTLGELFFESEHTHLHP